MHICIHPSNTVHTLMHKCRYPYAHTHTWTHKLKENALIFTQDYDFGDMLTCTYPLRIKHVHVDHCKHYERKKARNESAGKFDIQNTYCTCTRTDTIHCTQSHERSIQSWTWSSQTFVTFTLLINFIMCYTNLPSIKCIFIETVK